MWSIGRSCWWSCDIFRCKSSTCDGTLLLLDLVAVDDTWLGLDSAGRVAVRRREIHFVLRRSMCRSLVLLQSSFIVESTITCNAFQCMILLTMPRKSQGCPEDSRTFVTREIVTGIFVCRESYFGIAKKPETVRTLESVVCLNVLLE